MTSQAQLSAAQQLASSGGMGASAHEGAGASGDNDDDDDDIPELEAVEEDTLVDETGVEAKDIEIVMTQVGCSRAKAVRALRQHEGDLINASACISFVLFPHALYTELIFFSVMAASD